MVSTYRVGSDTFSYTYNADGRITHIRQNNVLRGHYGYYADGQLRRENNLDTGKTVIYTYDNGGNLTKKTEYPYTTSGTLGTATATINYTYDSTWKDKLTSYNGQSISYDAMGNPTSYRGATLTWFGRQLKSYTKGNTSVSYKYDENGLRTQKTVNGVVHDYYYVGDRLVYEKFGNDYEFLFCYDADGRLAMVERVIISSGAKGYFFTITNAQGDVIKIRNSTGAVIARYNYDAFGKLISTTDDSGNILTGNSFATQINVRYRGYYYDSETGLYYLQSRYYDPETGRFLNADDVNFLGTTETLLSYNAFAYCENDPVNKVDPSGSLVAVAPLKKIIVYMDSIVLLLIACGALSAGAGNSWNPAGWILLAGGAAVVVGSIVYLYYYDAASKQIKIAKRTKIPSKLKSKKNKDRIKTPDTDPGEFNRDKQGDYIHKKTGWKFHKDKSGHFGGPHWDVGPGNGKTGDYYDVSREGVILK